MLKLLLTGGGGFIGRNLYEHLSPRHEIVAPRSAELDLTDEHAVAAFLHQHRFDAVIHSAVRPGHRNAPDPTRQLFINTRMFFNLMRHADRFGTMIFLGSGAVYDVRRPMAKIDEGYFDTNVPADEHGFSKYLIAKYAEKVDNLVKLRLFGIFGKYEDYTIRFISNAICKALYDLPITLRQNRRFDYLYVDDLGTVVEHFLHNRGAYTAYNVTPDAADELLAIAELVRARSGKDLPIVVGQDELGPEYSGSNARLRAEIPHLSLTPLAEAIDRLYAWYEANLHLVDRERLLVDW
jgi:GDP-L-fucose synthase